MANELLEFNAQAEFNFKMSSFAESGQKEELESDCKQAVEHAKSSFKEICLLALQLNEIKQKGHWENVINPKTGMAFFNSNFDEFTDYAFGLSKTKTSNLLRISQFVVWYGEDRGEIEPAYKGYGYSQLVELAPVPPQHRAYFNSDMTVDEMRVAKDYVKNTAEFLDEKKKEGFDLLEKATEWKERKKTSAPAKTEQLEGQTSLFDDEETDGEDMRNPTSDFGERGEEVDEVEEIAEEIEQNACVLIGYGDDCEPAEGEVWQGGGIDRDTDDYDEQAETQEDMQADMETIEEDAEKSLPAEEDFEPILRVIPTKKEYKFNTRDEIRFFVSDYKNWHTREDIRTPFAETGYWCTLKNYDIINVLEANTISNRSLLSEAEEIEEKGPIYFLYRAKYQNQPSVMIGKVQLEVYLMAIRDSLK